MMDPREANYYLTYITSLSGAKLTVLPPMPHLITHPPSPHPTQAMTETFMGQALASCSPTGLDDLFEQKKSLSEDQVNLILAEIQEREMLKSDNLKRLYDDLTQINNWRLERPYPDNYRKDKTWTDLNKMELELRDQIRRELKDASRDTAFPQKDLRESLIEFKRQTQKAQMMAGLDMCLESSNEHATGDAYSQHP
jgi:hypothetical protein